MTRTRHALALGCAIAFLAGCSGTPEGPISEPKVMKGIVKQALKSSGDKEVIGIVPYVAENRVNITTISDPNSYGKETRIVAGKEDGKPEASTTYLASAPIAVDKIDYAHLLKTTSEYAKKCSEQPYTTVRGTFGNAPLIEHSCLHKDASNTSPTGVPSEFYAGTHQLKVLENRSNPDDVKAMVADYGRLLPEQVSQFVVSFGGSLDWPYVSFRTTYLGETWPGKIERRTGPTTGNITVGLLDEDLSKKEIREAELAKIPESSFPWKSVSAEGILKAKEDAEEHQVSGTMTVAVHEEIGKAGIQFTDSAKKRFYEFDGTFIKET